MSVSGNTVRSRAAGHSGRTGSHRAASPERAVCAQEDSTAGNTSLSRPRRPVARPGALEQARTELLAILSKPFESSCAACEGHGSAAGQACSRCDGSGLITIRLL